MARANLWLLGKVVVKFRGPKRVILLKVQVVIGVVPTPDVGMGSSLSLSKAWLAPLAILTSLKLGSRTPRPNCTLPL